LTGEHGADRVIDILGGEALDRNISASARFGHIVLVSTAGGAKAEINAARLMMKQMTLSGSTLRPQTSEVKAAVARSLRANVWPALEDGRIIKPRIQSFPLTDAATAHRALESRANYGKIVLVTDWGFGQSN
jgi:NADPH2:quinone reductase